MEIASCGRQEKRLIAVKKNIHRLAGRSLFTSDTVFKTPFTSAAGTATGDGLDERGMRVRVLAMSSIF
jgi:hypothetical protein